MECSFVLFSDDVVVEPLSNRQSKRTVHLLANTTHISKGINIISLSKLIEMRVFFFERVSAHASASARVLYTNRDWTTLNIHMYDTPHCIWKADTNV